MPKASYEHHFQDLQHAFEWLQDVMAPRGLYVESSILFLPRARRPAELWDVVVELVVRKRHAAQLVWRGTEGLRVPGRAKLRPVASVLFGLMTRAAIDIDEKYPLPSGGQSRGPGGARN